MRHPDHFSAGDPVIGPLDFHGIVEEVYPGYCLINFAHVGVRQWLPIGWFKRLS